MKLRRQGSHQRRFASLESVCENCGMKTKWVRHTKFDAIRPGYATTVDDTGGCTDGKFVVQISSDISVSFLSLRGRGDFARANSPYWFVCNNDGALNMHLSSV